MTSAIRSRMNRILAGAIAAGTVMLSASGAFAATNLGTFDFWTAWTDTDNGTKICYVSSTPQTKAPASANRDPIHFIVTIRPTNRNEVATIVGYPIHQTNANASTTIDGKSYQMVTQGSSAWLASIEDEPRFVAGMRAGSSMVVKATSQRGTNTVDTYSLKGITAALNKINAECK